MENNTQYEIHEGLRKVTQRNVLTNFPANEENKFKNSFKVYRTKIYGFNIYSFYPLNEETSSSPFMEKLHSYLVKQRGYKSLVQKSQQAHTIQTVSYGLVK